VHSITAGPISEPDGWCNVIGVSSLHACRRDPARVKAVQALCAQTWDRYAQLSRRPCRREADTRCCLTRKEVEVLRWIKHGKSNADISEILHLSVKTIEYHVSNIFKKLGATNRITAVVIAIRTGVVEL
jgi:DNA-binding NarL/FixJ family response regulator